ncbi:MAG TPA: preprotein translocase subunit SecE [Opitutales bacterium]|nr:preprotein translocase subunit SecE [Opitutales bacterium]
MKNPFRSIRIFAGETVTELKKATWPTWAELKNSTIVVIIAVIILGIFISIADFSLFQVVYLFTEWVTAAKL